MQNSIFLFGNKGIIMGVVGILLVTLLLNGALFGLGLAGQDVDAIRRQTTALPPGWVIGVVWTILLPLMGGGCAALRQSDDAAGRRLAWWGWGFLAFCLAYPLYTNGFRNDWAVYAGNLLTIVGAAFLSGRLWGRSRWCGWVFLLPALWVCFATLAKINP